MNIDNIHVNNYNFYTEQVQFLKSKSGLGKYINNLPKITLIMLITFLFTSSIGSIYYLLEISNYFEVFEYSLSALIIICILIPTFILTFKLIYFNTISKKIKTQNTNIQDHVLAYGVILHSTHNYLTFLCYTENIEKEIIIEEVNQIIKLIRTKKRLNFKSINSLIEENDLQLQGKIYLCDYHGKKVKKTKDTGIYYISQDPKKFRHTIATGIVSNINFIPFGHNSWQNNKIIEK